MADFLTEIRGTLVPDRAGRHGPLPLLIGLTLVTSLVDAFSYLTLGHVFVANMTGNVVFLGFALAGAPGFSIAASLAAVAAFGFGALLGGLAAPGTARTADICSGSPRRCRRCSSRPLSCWPPSAAAP